jgi:hypothetical protein
MAEMYFLFFFLLQAILIQKCLVFKQFIGRASVSASIKTN